MTEQEKRLWAIQQAITLALADKIGIDQIPSATKLIEDLINDESDSAA